MTPEEQAREVIDKLQELNDWALNDRCSTAIITNAMRAAKTEGLEEAMTHLEANAVMPPHIGPLWNAGWTAAATGFAQWCRSQADALRKEQP